jgi:hypothetical protein
VKNELEIKQTVIAVLDHRVKSLHVHTCIYHTSRAPVHVWHVRHDDRSKHLCAHVRVRVSVGARRHACK